MSQSATATHGINWQVVLLLPHWQCALTDSIAISFAWLRFTSCFTSWSIYALQIWTMDNVDVASVSLLFNWHFMSHTLLLATWWCCWWTIFLVKYDLINMKHSSTLTVDENSEVSVLLNWDWLMTLSGALNRHPWEWRFLQHYFIPWLLFQE